MRGLLFTEYLDFVAVLGQETVAEEILIGLEGQITGAYTAVGNYSFDEFSKIHSALSLKLDLDPAELARRYGYWLLGRFKALFPAYFDGVSSGLEFLEKTGTHIHVEVRKLYPDAAPPAVALKRLSAKKYELTYRSHRPLAAVAHGLTEACLEDFGDPFEVTGARTEAGATIFEIQAI